MKGLLKVRNNWEAYEYVVDGERVNPKTIESVTVNGFGPFDVEIKTSSVAYNDHGHTYHAERLDLLIALNLSIPDTSVKVDPNEEMPGIPVDISLMEIQKKAQVRIASVKELSKPSKRKYREDDEPE